MADSGAVTSSAAVPRPVPAVPQPVTGGVRAGAGAGRRRALRRGPDPRRPVALVRLNPAEREQVTAAAARAQLSVAAFLAKAGLAAAGGLEAPGGPISGLAAQVYQLRSHLGRVHATLNWLKTNAAVGRPVSAAQLDAAVVVTRRLMDRVGETEQRLSRRIR